jgi:hypothetical protein
MKNKPVSALLIIPFLVACNPSGEQAKPDIETEIIDFWSFQKIESEAPASVIKKKEYILLDSSDDNFLFKSIYKIIIKDSKIYILDKKLKKLLVFTLDGKGLGKVGQAGQGPEEYLQIDDFDVNSSGDIYLIDCRLDKLFVFDKNFKFVSARKMPFEVDIIHCLPDSRLLFGLSSWNKGKNAGMKITVTDLELNTLAASMPYDEYFDNSYWISSYIFVDDGENILYNKPIDNYVYQFSETGKLTKAYLFDFGNKNVPDKYKKDIEGNLEKYKNYCCLKNFTVISDRYIAGTVWNRTETKTFIIDRNNRKLYLGETTADADKSNIAGYCNNQIISFIYPGKYPDIQSVDLPPDVIKHIEDENFVICLNHLE